MEILRARTSIKRARRAAPLSGTRHVASIIAIGGACLLVAGGAAASVPDYSTGVLADSPNGYWRLNESSTSSPASDSSGAGHPGAYASAGVSLALDGAIDTNDDTASSFNGGGTINDPALLIGGASAGRTYEFWLSTLQTSAGTVLSWSNGCPKHVSVYLTAPGQVQSVLYIGGLSTTTTTTQLVNDGDWHHVAVVFPADQGSYGVASTIYVDGAAAAATVTSHWAIGCGAATSAALAVGAPLNGQLDDLASYGTPLTSSQVSSHYAAAQTYDFVDPTLTAQQVTQAQNILQGDSRFLNIVGSTSYTITSTNAWVRQGTGANIGALMEVTLPAPQAFTDVVWPSVTYDDSETSNPPYTTGTYQETFTEVTELDALVDLNSGQLVSINPGGAAVDDVSNSNEQASPPTPSPMCVPNLRRVRFKADWFWNYDFSTQDLTPGSTASRCKVDNPITLLFINNADVNKAKAAVGWAPGCAWDGNPLCDLHHAATPANLRLRDGVPDDGTGRPGSAYNATWDSDRGSQTGAPCIGTKYHYRVYAPGPDIGGDDRFYNTRWGYYVVASTHVDYHDKCSGKWSGESEIVEGAVAADARSRGLLVDSDSVAMFNPLPFRQFATHRWLNDGLASTITLP
jgi:hypothetical protein